MKYSSSGCIASFEATTVFPISENIYQEPVHFYNSWYLFEYPHMPQYATELTHSLKK